eukprot:1155566-Pelagomonas_calceolata.AAC.1
MEVRIGVKEFKVRIGLIGPPQLGRNIKVAVASVCEFGRQLEGIVDSSKDPVSRMFAPVVEKRKVFASQKAACIKERFPD